MKFPFLIIAICLLFGCKKNTSPDYIAICPVTTCMQISIDYALSQSKGSVLYSIDAYEYNGATVYLYYAGCCDRYNELKDANCNYLFAPSGGFTGGGDHSHPNFFKEAKFIKTAWVDPRP
jgi:hypothetical protein